MLDHPQQTEEGVFILLRHAAGQRLFEALHSGLEQLDMDQSLLRQGQFFQPGVSGHAGAGDQPAFLHGGEHLGGGGTGDAERRFHIFLENILVLIAVQISQDAALAFRHLLLDFRRHGGLRVAVDLVHDDL